ncbi:MAG: porin [Bacteriovoracaceae bacterium]|nr:OprO/OprP family phosphate-selective porin [Bacteroidota bacterium]
MLQKNKNSAIRRFGYIAAFSISFAVVVYAGDIRPSVEVEFNMFYNRNYPQPLSFQFREAKLFLDANISDHATAMIEYTMKDNLVRSQLERAYFIQHDLPLNSQLTLGQFRNPFGYFDPFTVSHSTTKSTALTPDSLMPKFMLRDLDVGLYWESNGEAITFGFGVTNGNGINDLKDDNNFKDIVGHAVYSFGELQIGLNGYYGKKNSMLTGEVVNSYSSVEVTAAGVEAMAYIGEATIAWEALVRNYGTLHSAGSYVTMNYDLSSILPTLRATSRVEVFDPNRTVLNDESIQWAQGFLYTLSRGYLAKLEVVLNLENLHRRANEVFFELEYEL